MPPLIIKNSISIDAPASRVWDALVNPAQTKKYMFGCEAISDWKIGSPLIWRGVYEGNEMIFVKGNIVELIPEKLLAYTVIDPNSGIAEHSGKLSRCYLYTSGRKQQNNFDGHTRRLFKGW